MIATVVNLDKHNLTENQRSRPRRARLTDDVVAALRPGVRIYDSDVGGFFVERGKTAISWRVHADLPKAARKAWVRKTSLTRTVGRYPRIKAREARRVAGAWLGSIKAGVDPCPKAPQHGAEGWTLQQAWCDYRDDFLAKKQRSPNTIRFYEACFNRVPRLHDVPLTAIAASGPALKAEHARLTEAHGENAADSTIGYLAVLHRHTSGVFSGMAPWPARAVTKHGRKSRADRGMGPADLPAWWQQVLPLRPSRRELLLFLMLSGLRSTDARTARWEHVDESKRLMLVPCPKGGPKRAFHLPLSTPMLACLRRARDDWAASGHAPSAFLFPTQKGGFADIRARKNGVRIKSGHDLRHTFSNVARAAGIPEPIVAVLMNHKTTNVTGGYHDPASTPGYYLDAMEKISAFALAALEPQP